MAVAATRKVVETWDKNPHVCLIKAYNSPDLSFDLSKLEVHYLNLFKKMLLFLFCFLNSVKKHMFDGLKIQY